MVHPNKFLNQLVLKVNLIFEYPADLWLRLITRDGSLRKVRELAVESHHAGSSISLIRVTAVIEKSRGWEKKDMENLISCSSEEFFCSERQ